MPLSNVNYVKTSEFSLNYDSNVNFYSKMVNLISSIDREKLAVVFFSLFLIDFLYK